MDKEAVGMEREAVTVWKDGRYKFWRAADAAYAQNDPDWLATIPLAQQPAAQAVGLTDTRIMEIFCREATSWHPGDNPPECIYIARAIEREVLSRVAPSAQQAEPICVECNGSGEGVADTTCLRCNGQGGFPQAERPAAAEAQVIPRTEHEYRIPILGEKQATHSRQAQGGALSDEQRELALLKAIDLPTLAEAAAFRKGWKAAILARAASEPRAEGLTAAARDVLAERQRQITAEGWTLEHDDQHADGQMAAAAGYYALACSWPHERDIGRGHVPTYWPWTPDWWKPKAPRSNLVRAGALILAEIERLDRAAQNKGA